MKVSIITIDKWNDTRTLWKEHSETNYNDNFIKDIHFDHGDIVLVSDINDYPLMAMNIVVAELPGMDGKTLRSTSSTFCPEIEYGDYPIDGILSMYAKCVCFIYQESIKRKCDNIKVYTPETTQMTQWKSILDVICEVENINRTVMYMGRWTALVKKKV